MVAEMAPMPDAEEGGCFDRDVVEDSDIGKSSKS